MLKETYDLLKYLEKQISFKGTISIILNDNFLILQIFFRKDNTPYYFTQAVTEEETKLSGDYFNEKSLINIFIKSLEEFYLKANTKDFEESALINQTIITRKGEQNDRTNYRSSNTK